MEWGLEQIKGYARDFLKERYSLPLMVPVKINGRLQTTLGQVKMLDKDTPLAIEISRKLIQKGKDEDIEGVIKHECIHYAMITLNRPSFDGDKEFELELVKQGAPATNTIKFPIERKVNVFECECQEHIMIRKRIGGFKCIKCNEYLRYKGQEMRVM